MERASPGDGGLPWSQVRPGKALSAAVVVPLGPLGSVLGFTAMPPSFWPLLAGIAAAYLALVELVKRRFEPHG